MAIAIPTSKDIYLEVNGQRLAVVQRCAMHTTRDTKSIEAFGSEYPVASVGGKITHRLVLHKVVPLRQAGAQEVDFYSLRDFTVMVVKPDSRIVFSGCEWSSIGEQIDLNAPCIETVEVTASKRMVVE